MGWGLTDGGGPCGWAGGRRGRPAEPGSRFTTWVRPAGGWVGWSDEASTRPPHHRRKVSAPEGLRRVPVQTDSSHRPWDLARCSVRPGKLAAQPQVLRVGPGRDPMWSQRGGEGVGVSGVGGVVPRVRSWAPVWVCMAEDMAVGLGGPASRVLPPAVRGRLCLQGLRRRGRRPPSLSPQVSQPALARAFNPRGLCCPARSRVLLAGGAPSSSSPCGAQGFCLLPSGRPNR